MPRPVADTFRTRRPKPELRGYGFWQMSAMPACAHKIARATVGEPCLFFLVFPERCFHCLQYAREVSVPTVLIYRNATLHATSRTSRRPTDDSPKVIITTTVTAARNSLPDHPSNVPNNG